jgi:Ca2+/Na+ antiporter
LRLVLAGVVILIGMISMIAGIGIIHAALLLEESGVPRRYQSTSSTNIHDSYYTIDLFGFIPMGGTPDVRIGWLIIGVSLLIYCVVAILLVKSHVPKRKMG